MVQLHRHDDEFRAAGATLHVIGSGAPMFIDGFRETTGFSGPVYTDPSLAVFEAAGLHRSVRAMLDPRAAVAALGALRRGFRQGRSQGDELQQGGVLVVAPSGAVVWAQASRYAGDNAPAQDVLAALLAARA